MENLLEYVIYALLGHDYEVGARSLSYDGHTSQWMVKFEGNVRLIFDEKDVCTLEFMQKTTEDPDVRERIGELLKRFVW